MEERLEAVQACIHYQFQQVKLLELALTHSSWANERAGTGDHNERLEFLGDAVLELCVTEELFRRFPDAREGDLTRLRARLVNKPALSEVAREMRLEQYLLLGRGEESQGGRERHSLLGDALEAVLGAVFLDGGFAKAKQWVVRALEGRWPDEVDAQVAKDYKSRLQEVTQKRFKGRPIYALVASTGPEHDKIFDVKLTLPTGENVTASGKSLRKAEQKAAARALARLTRPADVAVAPSRGPGHADQPTSPEAPSSLPADTPPDAPANTLADAPADSRPDAPRDTADRVADPDTA